MKYGFSTIKKERKKPFYSRMLKNVREAGKVRNIQNLNLGFFATIFWAPNK